MGFAEYLKLVCINQWVLVPDSWRKRFKDHCKQYQEKDQMKNFQQFVKDNDVYWNKLMFRHPAKKGRDGYFVLGNSTDTKECVKPPLAYLKWVFPDNNDGSENRYIASARKTPGTWVVVESGAYKNPDNSISDVPPCEENAPIVPFIQGNGAPTCMFSSLASGLHWFGDMRASDRVSQLINQSVEQLRRFHSANSVLRTTELGYSTRMYDEGELDILNDLSPFPTLCVLKGKDGATNHAVTVVGRWIFDSTLPYAVPLTKNVLDWCCSTETEEVQFVMVHKALRCHRDKVLKGWRNTI